MISSGAFNYINILEKTADASWLRHSVISNNIANADTPTYKRKDVTFQSYLEEKLTGGETQEDAVADAELDLLNGRINTDYSTVSYRLDGNNVDIDTENSYLPQNQIKYYTVLDSVSQEFSRLRSVCKNGSGN